MARLSLSKDRSICSSVVDLISEEITISELSEGTILENNTKANITGSIKKNFN